MFALVVVTVALFFALISLAPPLTKKQKFKKSTSSPKISFLCHNLSQNYRFFVP